MAYSEEFAQKVGDCRELYLKHGGQHHELIEKEMRELGYRDFHRRCLYRRFERGTCQPGWVETYGWNSLLKELKKKSTAETQRRGEAEENWPRINADDADRSRFENDLFDPDPRYPRPSAAKSLPLRLGVPAVQTMSDFDEFKDWLKRTWPDKQWEFKHQVYIYKHLKRVWDGDSKRLMIFLPPRHGKSELVTVRFPTWALKQNPKMKIIIGSYNQRLANRFSRMVRSALAEDAFREEERSEIENGELRIDNKKPDGDVNTIRDRSNHFGPTKCPLAGENSGSSNSQFSTFNSQLAHRTKNSEAEWETEEGGGVRAVGMGAGVTGYGAQLIIIDDPVKGRAEAESETIREKVWNWFNDDIYTRLAPDGKIILIQTRWHEDDLAGRLLREAAEEGGEQWEVISLPALAESEISNYECRITNSENQCPEVISSDSDNSKFEIRNLKLADPLGRAPGEALCPEWFDEQALDRVRRKLGSYSFAALYQQNPVPAEGGLFKRAWFRTVNAAPPNLRWKRGYDLGISKNSTADYTASLRVAYDKAGNMYIDGGFRRRIEYPEQRRFILGRIQAESNTEHGIELSANGNAVVQDLRREAATRGRALRGVKVNGDKVTNALPWIALAEEGKVFLVRGAWNAEFIDEAASFPSGTHDDQIDAVSIAVRMHREQRGRLYTF